MIYYAYNKQFNPPAPFVYVRLRCPQTGAEVTDIPALLDTAADRTTIPGTIVTDFGLVPIDEASVSVYGGAVSTLLLFDVQIAVRELELLDLKVFGNDHEPYVILGRDILNKLHIVLKGPQLALEIS
jgi:predicted aspartyl protease